MLAQAANTDPVAAVEIIRAATPVVSALIALSGVLAGLRHSGRRDDARMKQERELKDRELEATRSERLRDERIRAYTHFITATATTRLDQSHYDEEMVRASESVSEVQLLGGSEELQEAAFDLYENYQRVAEKGAELHNAGKDPDQDDDYQNSMAVAEEAKTRFMYAAREELGIPLPTPRTGDPATSSDSEAGTNT